MDALLYRLLRSLLIPLARPPGGTSLRAWMVTTESAADPATTTRSCSPAPLKPIHRPAEAAHSSPLDIVCYDI